MKPPGGWIRRAELSEPHDQSLSASVMNLFKSP